MDPLFTPQHWRMQNSPQPQNGYQKFEYKGKYIVSNEKRMSKADLIEQNEHYKESSFHHDSEPNSLLHENEYEYGTLMEEYYSNNLSSHPSTSNFSKPTMNKIIREPNDNFYANDKNNFKLKTKSKNKRNFNYNQVNHNYEFSDNKNNEELLLKSNEAFSANDKFELANQNIAMQLAKGSKNNFCNNI